MVRIFCLIFLVGLCDALARPSRVAFFECVSVRTPAFAPSTPLYSRLVGLGLRNNTATPVAIVLADNAEHVSDAVRCARRASLTVCARSGGHSYVGSSLCSGVLIDVAPMRKVSVPADGVAFIQAGAVMGEILWRVWLAGRWLGGGVCPSVGAGGYFFGGGHSPYEGSLGLACDSIVEVTLIDRFGKMIVASKTSRPDLFWSLCGAGGGQFGIVTSFRIKTVDRTRYDNGVIFRFSWKKEYVGELMEKWTYYKEMDGNVWFRLSINGRMGPGVGIIGLGACYDVLSTDACLKRLKLAPFFNTPGRETHILAKVQDALHLHSFFGPGGIWGNAEVQDVQKGMLNQRHSEAGFGNERSSQSSFLKFGDKARPSAKFWAKYAEICADSGSKLIAWTFCELNLFNGAVLKPQNNAFAHRDARVISLYVVQGKSAEARNRAYSRMRDHLATFTSGVYVNYPALELGKTYARAYWGNAVSRLQQVKNRYDPNLFFSNAQPIPPLASQDDDDMF